MVSKQKDEFSGSPSRKAQHRGKVSSQTSLLGDFLMCSAEHRLNSWMESAIRLLGKDWSEVRVALSLLLL